MIIEPIYIQGIVDATVSLWESENGVIEPNKQLTFSYDPIYPSNKQPTAIGCKITFTCITKYHNDWLTDEHERYENYIKVYNKDSLDGLISDISSELTDIDNLILQM